MRRLESEVLREALASPVPAVVAAAAGVVMEETTRRRLREAFVAWLQARPETLAARVTAEGARPLLGEDPLAVLREMEQQRRYLYESVADIVVDVDGLTAGEAAVRIAQAVPWSVERDCPN